MSFGAHRHTFLLCLAPESTSDKLFTFLRSFSFSSEQVNEVSLDRLSLPQCLWQVCRKLVLSTSLHSCSCFPRVVYVRSKLPDVKGVTLSFFLQITSSRGAVLTSAASTSPVSLLQMHVLRPFPRPTDQRVGLEPRTLCIHKPSREFWCPLTFENCCFSQLSSPITFFSAFTQCKALGRKGIHSFAVHLFTQYLLSPAKQGTC